MGQSPTPRFYVIGRYLPDAFTTGRDLANTAVAAPTRMLRSLSERGIARVMAQQLAQIRNRNTLLMTITATLAGEISMLFNSALFDGGNRNNPLGLIRTSALMFLAPRAAALVQMAISYTRKDTVDRGAAKICGKPLSLASALEKLKPAEFNPPATAHLFIVDPLHEHTADGLFCNHPAMSNRIRRLHEMAGRAPREQGLWGPR